MKPLRQIDPEKLPCPDSGPWGQAKTFKTIAGKFIAAYGWEHAISGIRVLRSVSTTEDQKKWIHLSVSYPTRTPTWDEMCHIKEIFIGDFEGYQVMPLKEDYINLMSHCLHMWFPLDQKRCVANLQDLVLEFGA